MRELVARDLQMVEFREAPNAFACFCLLGIFDLEFERYTSFHVYHPKTHQPFLPAPALSCPCPKLPEESKNEFCSLSHATSSSQLIWKEELGMPGLLPPGHPCLMPRTHAMPMPEPTPPPHAEFWGSLPARPSSCHWELLSRFSSAPASHPPLRVSKLQPHSFHALRSSICLAGVSKSFQSTHSKKPKTILEFDGKMLVPALGSAAFFSFQRMI